MSFNIRSLAFKVKISLVGIKAKLFIIKDGFWGIVLVFYSMHFRLRPVPSGGFLKKEARQFQFHLTRVK